MTDDDMALVDRLRWVSEWYFVDPVDGVAYASDDPLDAADRIEVLSAENERLREALERIAANVHAPCARLMTHPDMCRQAYEARAALGETK